MKKNLNIFLNNKKIIENFSFLSLFQLFTLVSPLITYPYLIKVVGLELYGTVVFAQTVVTYLSLIINFGYNTSGPKEVSILKENHLQLSEFVSSVFIVKSILWAITFIVFMLVISIFNYFHQYYLLYFFTFFITVGDVLFPIWFFQGIEKMKYITYINIVVKIIFIACIFIFIKQKEDYVRIPIINSIGALVSGIISIYLVFKRENVDFIKVKFIDVKKSFQESFVLFVSSLSISIYLSLNKLIVGTFLGMKDVAIYDLAERIVSMIKTPILIFSQAIFPKISREKSISFINKAMYLVFGVTVIAYIFLFFLGNKIIFYFTGTANILAFRILMILGSSLIFTSIAIFYGGLRLIPFGYNKQYMIVMMANSLIYIFIIIFIIIFKQASLSTIAMAYVLAEAFGLAIVYYFNFKLKLLR